MLHSLCVHLVLVRLLAALCLFRIFHLCNPGVCLAPSAQRARAAADPAEQAADDQAAPEPGAAAAGHRPLAAEREPLGEGRKKGK